MQKWEIIHRMYFIANISAAASSLHQGSANSGLRLKFGSRDLPHWAAR